MPAIGKYGADTCTVDPLPLIHLRVLVCVNNRLTVHVREYIDRVYDTTP